jgi:energy-coupling factor transporter ATP-binding protein EcfA2
MGPSSERSAGDSGPILLNKVSYSYPANRTKLVLENLALTIRSGEYLLISGASGSGKSTLVRTFNGLIPHFYGGTLTGTVIVDGRPTTEQTVTDLFDRVGLVLQNPQAQLFNRTVTQDLAFGLESLGLPRTQMVARISSVAEELAIQSLLDRDPQALSGGEQQLVALAAVLALRPGIVVLDEPLANLDAFHVRNLRNLLKQLCDQGIGVVVCEHRMVPTLPDAHRIALIHQGMKLLDGRPEEVLKNPDWARCGVELPLAVKMGLAGGVHPLPLGI